MPELPPENFQRVGMLAALPSVLRRLGADPVDVLAAAGLSPQALDHPEGTIPYAAMGRLVDAAVEKTKCPHFGLLIGEHIGIAALGLIGELMRNAPTVDAALRDFVAHHHRNAQGGVAYLLNYRDQARAFLGYAIYHPKIEASPVLYDGAAMAAFNIVSELALPLPVDGMEVLLSRAEPQDMAEYRRLLSVPLHFNAHQTGALFPFRWLDRPVAGANAGLRNILGQRAEALWPAGELNFVTQLRRKLQVGLLSGHFSSSDIAAGLGMHPQTIYRRLRSQGTHFQTILDEIRCEFAQQLLANTRLRGSEIASILRYTDPPAFTRAFVRWTGETPSEWRSSPH